MGEREGRHLDDIELDAVRAGEGDARSEEHLRACARCRSRLEGISADAEALREAHRHVSLPPPAVEARILRHLTRRSSSRSWRRLAPPLGAAAAVLFLFVYLQPGRESSHRDSTEREEAPSVSTREKDPFLPASPGAPPLGDINGDGDVGEADVTELARLVKEGAEGLTEWDFNGDGLTDTKDIDYFSRSVADADGDADALQENEVSFGC